MNFSTLLDSLDVLDVGETTSGWWLRVTNFLCLFGILVAGFSAARHGYIHYQAARGQVAHKPHQCVKASTGSRSVRSSRAGWPWGRFSSPNGTGTSR